MNDVKSGEKTPPVDKSGHSEKWPTPWHAYVDLQYGWWYVADNDGATVVEKLTEYNARLIAAQPTLLNGSGLNAAIARARGDV